MGYQAKGRGKRIEDSDSAANCHEKRGEAFFHRPSKVKPDKLLEKLTELFKSTPQVTEAYYAQVFFPNRAGDKPHLMLGIKFLDGEEDHYLYLPADIGKILTKMLDKGEYADVVPISREADPMIKRLVRFYSKSDPKEKGELRRLFR